MVAISQARRKCKAISKVVDYDKQARQVKIAKMRGRRGYRGRSGGGKV
jgi:hypothetical protein